MSLACNERFDFDVPIADASLDADTDADADADTDADTDTDAAETGKDTCTASGDCGHPSLHCDLTAQRCVECLEDAHCIWPGLPRCDVALRRCIECGVDADCGLGRHCEPGDRRCVSLCSADEPCPRSDQSCDEDRGLCVACSDQLRCQDPEEPYCLAGGSRCVECVTEADCPTAHCDPVGGRCVECRSSADCSGESVCEAGEWHCHSL